MADWCAWRCPPTAGSFSAAAALVVTGLAGTSAAYVEVTSLIGLTRARQSLGHLRDARQDAESALSLATRHGYRSLEGQARTALATVHLALGRTEAAREEALLALRLHQATGHRPGESRTRLLLAGLPDDCRVEVAVP